MSIKFDAYKLLENIEIGDISFMDTIYDDTDYFGCGLSYQTMVKHKVYYDALRGLFFTKEVYGVFMSVESLIKFYRDQVGDVRSYRDFENDIFYHDIICL